MSDIREQAVQVYDRYTHEHLDRRRLLTEMTALAGSLAAAEALIGGIAAAPAAAAVVPGDDKRLRTASTSETEAGAPLSAYYASPVRGPRKRGLVVVVHENRGLTEHIRDVARRVALAGFDAVAPDLLSPQGGTPADEDRARTLIGTADYDLALAQVQALIAGDAHRRTRVRTGRVGAVGFCWGGAFVNRLAIAAGARLAAGVAYYGPAPSPAEAARVEAPLMLHYAGKDARVAATGEPWVRALQAAGKPVEAFTYPGVDHAFNNDTSAERYDKAAADLAWGRTAAFLHRYLDA